ncbi:MAG TPA: type II toxin-antitoxin system VapC family toxin [Bryobacteraceae bacterium]|nr:type II toxin-antitoxin system VapC family toxin [Bryobacteraceae bacterium]
MSGYFVDTSALAKVYRKEVGSDFIDRIVSEPGSHRFISRFTILEMESVLALKFRTGEIDEQSLLMARRRLEADLAKKRLLVATLKDEHLRVGRQLLISHARTEALRGPDALQLAVALGLKRAGLASVFVAADKKLCRVAMIEGFSTINPEQPLTL